MKVSIDRRELPYGNTELRLVIKESTLSITMPSLNQMNDVLERLKSIFLEEAKRVFENEVNEILKSGIKKS